VPVEAYGAITLAEMYTKSKTLDDKKLVEQLREQKAGGFAFNPASPGYRKIVKMAIDVDEELKIKELARITDKGLFAQKQNFDLDKVIAACPGEMLDAMSKIGAKILEEQGVREKQRKTYLGSAKLFAADCYSAVCKAVFKSKDKNLKNLANDFKRISKKQEAAITLDDTPSSSKSRSNSIDSTSSITTTSSRSSRSSSFGRE